MEEMEFYSLNMYIKNEKTHSVEQETLYNLSLSDFEVIYGNEIREIVGIILLKQEKFKD